MWEEGKWTTFSRSPLRDCSWLSVEEFNISFFFRVREMEKEENWERKSVFRTLTSSTFASFWAQADNIVRTKWRKEDCRESEKLTKFRCDKNIFTLKIVLWQKSLECFADMLLVSVNYSCICNERKERKCSTIKQQYYGCCNVLNCGHISIWHSACN